MEMEGIGDLTTDVCSDMQNDTEKMCSSLRGDTRGERSVDTKKRYVEILNFRHFHKHIVFTDEGEKMGNKEIKDYINF